MLPPRAAAIAALDRVESSDDVCMSTWIWIELGHNKLFLLFDADLPDIAFTSDELLKAARSSQ